MSTHIVYLTVAITGLAVVARVLVIIGRVAAECPQTAGAARLGTWVVTTAFLAIGSGAIALLGAFLRYIMEDGFRRFMPSLGWRS